MLNKNYKPLPPFKWFVLQNFPFIEADFDAITEYQLLCKVIEYLNKNIDATNNLGTQVEALNNWFNNLDVQDEINNKLNEMTADGTLAQIINQQIFDELNTKIQNNTNEISELKRRKFLIVGDSYLAGWTPDGTYTNWGTFFQNITGFDCTIVSRGGAGFAHSISFYSMINEVEITDFTDVIIMGGYNDSEFDFSAIIQGIINTVGLIRNKFNKLKNIYIGMCGNSLHADKTNKLFNTLHAYIHGSKITNCHYLNGVEYSLLQADYFASDGYHPNQSGLYSIAINLVNSFYTGYANSNLGYPAININLNDNFSGSFSNFGGYQNNNIIMIALQVPATLTCTNTSLKANMREEIELGTIETNLVIRGNYGLVMSDIDCAIRNNNLYYMCHGQLNIRNGKVYFKCLSINNEQTDYNTFDDIQEIQLYPFNKCFISNTI